MNRFTNTRVIIRVAQGNTVDVYDIVTKKFLQCEHDSFSFDNCFLCDSFEITENVGGDVFVKTTTKMIHSDTSYTNEFMFVKGSIIEMNLKTSYTKKSKVGGDNATT